MAVKIFGEGVLSDKFIAVMWCMKKEIYSVISNVSRLKGICSPFIELENSIMYFPQLSYSDLGFLKYLCEQKNMKNYKLHIVSSCRGGKYVQCYIYVFRRGRA